MLYIPPPRKSLGGGAGYGQGVLYGPVRRFHMATSFRECHRQRSHLRPLAPLFPLKIEFITGTLEVFRHDDPPTGAVQAGVKDMKYPWSIIFRFFFPILLTVSFFSCSLKTAAIFPSHQAGVKPENTCRVIFFEIPHFLSILFDMFSNVLAVI